MTEPAPVIREGIQMTTIRFPVVPNLALNLELPIDWQLRDSADTVRTVQQATEQLAGILATLAAKDRLYGAAWRAQGWRGNLGRILSKTARLRAMLWRSDPVDDSREPVQDTAQDLINLCLFFLMNRASGNEWGRENGGE